MLRCNIGYGESTCVAPISIEPPSKAIAILVYFTLLAIKRSLQNVKIVAFLHTLLYRSHAARVSIDAWSSDQDQTECLSNVIISLVCETVCDFRSCFVENKIFLQLLASVHIAEKHPQILWPTSCYLSSDHAMSSVPISVPFRIWPFSVSFLNNAQFALHHQIIPRMLQQFLVWLALMLPLRNCCEAESCLWNRPHLRYMEMSVICLHWVGRIFTPNFMSVYQKKVYSRAFGAQLLRHLKL